MAADTCAIITSQQQIATAAELREVYGKLADANLKASEQRIITAICTSLQPPRAIPAYAAASPYSTYTPTVTCAAPVAATSACGGGLF